MDAEVRMDELVNDAIIEGAIEHHGIKGMRWGVRREDGPDGTVSSNPAVKTETPTAAHPKGSSASSSTSHLSDEELRNLVNRLQMERQLKTLSEENQKQADSFIKGLMKDIGKRQVRRVANTAADIAIEQALAKVGAKSGNPGIEEVAKRLGGKKKK